MQKQSNILVTGINGFVGPHLARELQSRNCNVIGVGHDSQPRAELAGQITYLTCDLTSEAATDTIDLGTVDAVIHLAGLSSQGRSFEEPQRFISDNSAMLIHLFESALRQAPRTLPRFLVISSGAVYDSNQAMPLTEKSATADNSPYVISKLLIEHLCHYYQKRGFTATVVRPFNHTGPGQGAGFLIPDLVAQVLEAGKHGIIAAGNLKTRRDYTDVRDIVRGYADLALTKQPSQSIFNLCSGESHSGEQILQLIAKAALGDEHAVTISVDPQKIRPNDPLEVFGDNSSIRKATGWKPNISLAQTINDYTAWFKSTKK